MGGGTTTNPYQPPGCWYYYETGQTDGISLTFNAAVSGQPADFLRSKNNDRFGFFCMGFDPPSAPPTPAPPIMPLTYGTGGDGQLSKCTRAEAETLDYMPTYNECYNLYVARGDFQGNAQMRFFEEPDPYNLDKDTAKGWCFLFVLQHIRRRFDKPAWRHVVQAHRPLHAQHPHLRRLVRVVLLPAAAVAAPAAAASAGHPGQLRRARRAHRRAHARLRLWRDQGLLLPLGKRRQLQRRLPLEDRGADGRANLPPRRQRMHL